MESRIEQAIEKKKSGKFNCAQAVACSYCDLVGMDEDTIKNVTNAFGSGMGSLEGSCGALAGAAVIIGLANKDRVKSMADMRLIMNRFKHRNGSVICKDLKGIGTNDIFRDCNDCIGDACRLLEQTLDINTPAI